MIPGLSQKDCLRGRGSVSGSGPKAVCQVISITIDISGAGGDRQNLRLEIRGASVIIIIIIIVHVVYISILQMMTDHPSFDILVCIYY